MVNIQEDQPKALKVYKKRWVILALYVLYACGSFLQYIEYPVIADVMVDYYQISYDAVNWTALVYSVMFIAFSLPVTHLMDKFGLRKTVLVGAIGTAVGSWIKVGSVSPDRFWTIILGQAIIAVFQMSLYASIPMITAAWFPNNQLATATAICLLGSQIGSGLSFVLPPLIVWKGDIADIERRFYILNISYATYCTVILPFIFFFFDNTPPTPPSIAQQESFKQKLSKPKSLYQTIKSLLKIKSYWIYSFIFGINIGVTWPLQILLNQVVLTYYPDATYDVGILGLLQTFLCVVGSTVASFILDKYKNFRLTTYAVYFSYLCGYGFYAGTVDLGLPYIYISSVVLGILLGAVTAVNFEIICELTYPEAESVASGLSINWAQLFSIAITQLCQYILNTGSILWANLTLIFFLLAANLMFVFLKFDLRRKAVQEAKNLRNGDEFKL